MLHSYHNTTDNTVNAGLGDSNKNNNNNCDVQAVPSVNGSSDEDLADSDTSDTDDNMEDGISSQRKVIINELLCYMQNRSQIETQEALVQTCRDFYGPEVVTTAKRILYENVNTNSRLLVRRGPSKTTSELTDIHHVFLEMEPSDTTTFVAHNLTDIPAIDNSTNSRLFKEMNSMKSDIKSLTQSQSELMKLMRDHCMISTNSVKHNRQCESMWRMWT